MKVLVLASYTKSLLLLRKDLLEEMGRRGHEVHASAPEEDEDGKIQALGVTFHQAPMERTGMNPLSDLQLIRYYRKLIRSIQPDVLFCYTIKPNIYGGFFGKGAGARRVYTMVTGLGNVFKPPQSAKGRAVQAVVKGMYRSALKRCDAVIFQNPDDRQDFVDMGMVEKGKTFLVNGSGVNMEHFQPSPLPESPAFLLVARLLPEKGVMEYLQAARMVKVRRPDVRFMLVGPYEKHPIALKKENIEPYVQDGSVEYFGEQKDVRPFYAMATAVALPCSFREGTPKTLLEAMACGRAILTTDTPGCREVLLPRENGLLLPPKDPQALGDAMLWMAKHPEETRAMGEKGLTYCREKYEVSKVNQSMMDIMML